MANQLLHGYRGGHVLLDGSIKLTRSDSELVTRLSDLSGSLSSGLETPPYLTCYPLPSNDLYAVARTWPDRDAPRAGCVLTHTILVPREAWGHLKNVRTIDHYFHNIRLNSNYSFADPIEIDTAGEAETHPKDLKIGQSAARTFVSRYFGQGVRPLVWLNAEDPDEVFWRLIEHLWPRLRSAFSCCTFSLQPRQLQDRPFDLLFAPGTVYSRFTKLAAEHLVDEGRNRKLSDGETEPWCEIWADALFSKRNNLPSGENDLPIWAELGEDPSDLRKLTIIQELGMRASESPTAGVGALDVVESIARDAHAGLSLKRSVIDSALLSAVGTTDVKEGLVALRLIDDRLNREAFREVSSQFHGAIEKASSVLARRDPTAAIQALEMSSGSSRGSAVFQNGIIGGLCEAVQVDSSVMRKIEQHPSTAIRMLDLDPSLAAVFLQSAGPSAPGQVASWLATTKDIGVLRAVRKATLPILNGTESEDMIRALLRDLTSAETWWTLDQLIRVSSNFKKGPFLQVAMDRVGIVYPAEVRPWALQERVPVTEEIASLLASTFTDSRAGFEALLSESRLNGERKALVLAKMLEVHTRSGMPYWLREIISEDPAYIGILLSARRPAPDVIDRTLCMVLEEVEDIRIPETKIADIKRFEESPLFPIIVDKVMRGALIDELIGEKERRYGENILGTDVVDSWLRTIPRAQLVSLISRGADTGPEGLKSAWNWIAEASDLLYQRRDAAISDLVEALLVHTRSFCDEKTGEAIASVLRRSRDQRDSDIHQALSAKCLQFSFDNTQLILGVVVAESFPDVYPTVASERRQSSFLSFFLLSYDWDKGKDLRIALVDAFMKSTWNPVYLALAAERAGILRKIFKRVRRRPKGGSYIASMASELGKLTSPECSRVREQLSWMISDPDFYEEWD